MDQQTSLKYHQATFDLIQEKPLIFSQAIEILDQLERESNFILPASVREWYSLEEAVAILLKNTENHPVNFRRLGEGNRFDKRWYEIDISEKQIIPILVENQGVCVWGILLNGSDDPPVVVSFEDTNPFATWEPYAQTFSLFVYTRVWDSRIITPDEDAILGWTERLLPEELAFLHEHFQEGPRTFAYPRPLTYRFFSGSQRIFIHTGGIQGKYETEWRFPAESDEELIHLVKTVKQCETLGKNLRLEFSGLFELDERYSDDFSSEEEA